METVSRYLQPAGKGHPWGHLKEQELGFFRVPKCVEWDVCCGIFIFNSWGY